MDAIYEIERRIVEMPPSTGDGIKTKAALFLETTSEEAPKDRWQYIDLLRSLCGNVCDVL
jgi:hypothetical protein